MTISIFDNKHQIHNTYHTTLSGLCECFQHTPIKIISFKRDCNIIYWSYHSILLYLERGWELFLLVTCFHFIERVRNSPSFYFTLQVKLCQEVCAGFLLEQNGLPLRPTAAGEKDVARDGWQQVELFGSLSVPLWAAP